MRAMIAAWILVPIIIAGCVSCQSKPAPKVILINTDATRKATVIVDGHTTLYFIGHMTNATNSSK